jgi:hypothetical protein
MMYSLMIGTYFIAAKHGRKHRKTVLDEAIASLLEV